MSAAPARQIDPAFDPKRQYLDGFEREHRTTVRVLQAYPPDKLDLRPHRMCKTARELAWMFVLEQKMSLQAVTTGLDFSNPMPRPEPPATMDAIIAELEKSHTEVADTVRAMPEERALGTIRFFTAPKTIGDVPTLQFLWMMLCDQIHHRGQFSIYLRMADGKVPSIYGPSADEPWT